MGGGYKRKIISYIVPYLFFSLFWWAYKFYLSASGGVVVEDLLLIFLYPISFLWFIYALLIMVLLQMRIGIPSKKWQYLHCVVCVICIIIHPTLVSCLSSIRFEDMIISDVMRMYLFFVIGVYGSQKLMKLPELKSLLLVALASFLVLMVGNVLVFNCSIQSDIINILIAVAGSLFVMSLSVQLSKSVVLQYLGRTSIAIYLLQNLGIIISKKSLDIIVVGTEQIGSIVLTAGTILGCLIPVILYMCATKVWKCDFVFTPSKYIK